MTRGIEETVRRFCRKIMKIHRTEFFSDEETLRKTVTKGTLLLRDKRTVIYSGTRNAERRLAEYDKPRTLKSKLIK